MNNMCRFCFSFLALLFLFAVSLSASAQPFVAPALTKQTPRPLMSPIAVQIQTLLGVPAIPTPATTATIPSTDAADTADTEPQETFGTKALNLLISEASLLHTEGDSLISNFAALPQLTSWYSQQINDPKSHDRWAQTGHDLVFIVGLSFIGAMALDFLFLPIRNSWRKRTPANLSRKCGTLLLILSLKLLPILVFLGVSLTMLDQSEPQKFPRFIALNAVYALALSRIVVALIRGFLAPRAEALRIIPASTSQAVYAHHWLSTFSLVIIYGYFVVDVARAIRIPVAVISAFNSLLGLALVLMTLLVIVQKRAFVAAILRGNLSAAHQDLSLFQNLRLWFARHWHTLAASYIVIGYLISAAGIENGFVLMLRGTILTLAIFAMMRVLFHATDHWGSADTVSGSTVHHTILRALLRMVIWIFALIAAAAAWGANIPAFFDTPLGQRLLGSAFSIGITVIVVALIYEGCNSAIERHLNRRDSEGKALQASARVRTLLPMIRNTIFIGFSVIVALVVMSEAGFNVAPLLAGAGIFGVALGFGSQTLVKDFLTGLFIVIENTIAIGDVVKIGDHSGTVEAMSVRTLRLRDQNGALHILPFSEVTNIINMTKDFAFALVNVGVSYSSDLDHVMNTIRSVGEEMQKDPIFKRVIVEPVEVLGVENLGDSSVTISARMRTRPGKQWDVRRQFLLKLKQRFDKEGIEIPFPTVTNIQRTIPSTTPSTG